MKLKLIGSLLGVLVAIGLIGAGTIWAKSNMPGETQSGALTSAQVGGQTNPLPGAPIDSQDAVTRTRNITATAQIQAQCTAFMTDLAGRLGVGVDKLTQATKDTAKAMIDRAVTDGKLTADQATAAKARIDAAQGNCVLGLGGFGRGAFPGAKGGPGFPGGKGAPGGPGFPGGRGPGPRGGNVITGTRSFDGATLTDVVANSPAAKAGLAVGDVILAIGGHYIDAQHPLNVLIAAKKPGDAVDVKYQHGSDTKTVSVTLGAQPNNAAVPYLGVQFQYRRSAS